MPETEGGVVKLNKTQCIERGCEFLVMDNSQHACLFKTRDKYGFSVNKITKTPVGTIVSLKAKGASPFPRQSVQFDEPVLEVNHRGINVLQFRVSKG